MQTRASRRPGGRPLPPMVDPGRPRGRGRRAGRGYNLVILVMLFAVLAIGLAAAGPYWSTMIRREREEELLFRGVQYAEAIRVFQLRNGRLPVRLSELLEVEPRAIRQLWPDPMTEDGKWSLILGASGAPITPPGGGGQQPPQPPQSQPPGLVGQPGQASDATEAATRALQEAFGQLGGTGSEQVGPISGVRSRSPEESFRIFRGATSYDQWQFVSEILPAVVGEGGKPRDPYVTTAWMTRALPEWAGAAQSGDAPGSEGQGGQSGGGDEEGFFGFGDSPGGQQAGGGEGTEEGEGGESEGGDPFGEEGEEFEEDDPFADGGEPFDEDLFGEEDDGFFGDEDDGFFGDSGDEGSGEEGGGDDPPGR